MRLGGNQATVMIRATKSLCLVFVFLLATAFAGSLEEREFRAGLSAYNISDYAAALAHWRPPAARGHANSQVALGHMYFHGFGVKRDLVQAAGWYRKAAKQNQTDALHLLGKMYLDGQGVAKNLVRAFVLCELALAQGEAAGLPCRESAKQSMSDDEFGKAERDLSKWNDLMENLWLLN